jgi:septal ring factor EnvC (AmiA/AmiB activator)
MLLVILLYFKKIAPYFLGAVFLASSLHHACAGEAKKTASNKVFQTKQELIDVQKKLDDMKKNLDNTQAAHHDAADALKESEIAISNTNKKLYEINQLQQKNKQKLNQLNQQSDKITQQLQSQQAILAKQLYAQYTKGEKNYAQMILQKQNPNEIARDLHYFSYIAKARAELIKKMQGNLQTLAELNEKTAEALEEVNTLKAEHMAQKKNLQIQKQAKSAVVKQLSSQIAEQRNAIQKLSRDEKNLSNLVEKLAKIAQEQEKQRRLAAKKSEKKSLTNNENLTENPLKPKEKEIVARNDAEPSAEISGVNFSTLKGKLRLPVRGSVLNRFGASREDTGISWKGLFIQATEGAEVKSVAGGRVVFADWMRGFGNLIIIDHGQGYMSLYGNNQAILKSVGTNVSAGDVIASVGNSGGNETNGLYYELRRQSQPFDPLSWSNLH